MTQVKEKNLWVKIDAEMTLMIEQADKDIKTIHNCIVSHMLKMTE